MIDTDSVMLYIEKNPDCSSLDISREFDITVAKAFTIANEMVSRGLAFKTIIRSPTNGKKILGYRTIPGYDEIADQGDGSMRIGDIQKTIRRLIRNGEVTKAIKVLDSHNDWRSKNGLRQIPMSEVYG